MRCRLKQPATQRPFEDALKLVCAAFGVSVKGNSKADMLMALEAYFITQVSQGKRMKVQAASIQSQQEIQASEPVPVSQ